MAALIAAAGILLGMAYVFTPEGSVHWRAFEPRFSAVVDSAGFRRLGEASCSSDEVPLPLRIRWHPRHWHNDSGPVSGFPDSAVHYALATDGSPPLDCFVRYLDSRATLIAIRASTAQEAAARDLRAALEREFPWLAITLTTHDV